MRNRKPNVKDPRVLVSSFPDITTGEHFQFTLAPKVRQLAPKRQSDDLNVSKGFETIPRLLAAIVRQPIGVLGRPYRPVESS